MRYEVYEADRSGESWVTLRTDSATQALSAVMAAVAARPRNAHGISDTDDPERGDVTTDLADEIGYGGK